MQEAKKIKWIYSIMSVVYIVAGVALIIWPSFMEGMICTILGIVAIVFGIIRLINYFVGDKFEALMRYDMVIGIFLVGLGLFVLIFPGVVISFLPVVFGLFLIISSLVKLQNAVDLKRLDYDRWWLILILAAVSIALGVILICNPFGAIHLLLIFVGVFFVVDGATSLYSMFIFVREVHIRKEAMKKKTLETKKKQQ
ncbi:MAG: DUF308 domain-containing protein [Lachnospiraceae bacterium]|nr:DUF308 domain-containing protein [Lachnospiraceae bacterium]